MRRRDFVALCGRMGALACLQPAYRTATCSERLSAPRLDVHTHVFGPAFVDRLRSLVNDPEIKAMVTTIEGHHIVDGLTVTGVDRALLLSTAGGLAGDDLAGEPTTPSDEYRDVREENDFTAAQAAHAPGRLIPFASVNPTREWAVEELERCIDDLGMRGVAVQFGSRDVRLRDPRHLQQVCACFSAAAERGVAVVAEVHNSEIDDLESELDLLVSRVIAPLPGLRALIAHLGSRGADRRADEAFAALHDAIARHPDVRQRVWVDCSAVFLELAFPPCAGASAERLERLATLLRAWPADRLLWGSDNNENALAEARRLWPLSRAAWETMARNDATGLTEVRG